MVGNTELSRVSPEAVQTETIFPEIFQEYTLSEMYLNISQTFKYLLSALQDSRRLYSETGNRRKKIRLSFKRPQARCAYLYDYSVLHSTMVYSEFLALLKQNKTYLLPACRRDSLKICCLGGGPGIETVAICRAIRDMILEDLASNHSISVHVTIIDKHPHWRREVSCLVNAMNDTFNPLHSHRILFHSNFMKADISKPFEERLIQKIREADIVTVVKLTASPENNSPESGDLEQRMMENIIESMRGGSFLFMLDYDEEKRFNNKVRCLTDKRPFSYMKTFMCNVKKLDARTIKKYEDVLKTKKDLNHLLVLLATEGKANVDKNAANFTSNSIDPDENNIGRTSNCRSTHSTVQNEKDNSSSIQNSCSSIIDCNYFFDFIQVSEECKEM